MLASAGFDLWADGYDRSVGLSDEDGSYPFAGYRDILGRIYDGILSCGCHDVLDLGFGTGTLTCRLYEQGCTIFGQDFSPRMIELARSKMPLATLVQGDFSEGLAPELALRSYDAIVATYSLHHLTDPQKVAFLRSLLPLLRDGGRILIGDVAFPTREALDACRAASGDEWDDEEIYFVADELARSLPCRIEFEQVSHCAGILRITNEPKEEITMGNLINGVHHICIKAKGPEAFEKAVHFYRDILGMVPVVTWNSGSAIMLDIGGGSRMEIFDNAEDEPGQGTIRHMALATDDVDACVKAVSEAGYEVFVQPKDVVLGDRPSRIAFCYGPVGEEIEFFCEK